jgi:putative nucleotidyltransferase with HDIG domain
VNRKEFGLADVSRVVAADAALTADVLRCANSAVFGRGVPVAGLSQAITRIGAREVTRLALSSGLAAHAQAPGSLTPLRRIAWIEGVACAGLCQELARHRGLDGEEAFVAGLLHDFGKVVATTFLEALLATHRMGGSRTLEAWAALLERHHVAAGLAIASQWNLPPLVSEVIAGHHASGAEGSQDRGLLGVVRAADRVVALLASQPHVSMADLAAIPSLSPAEQEVIARVVVLLPEFVAAFEAPADRPASAKSLVEAPLTTLAPGERAVTFGVSVSSRSARGPTSRPRSRRTGSSCSGPMPSPRTSCSTSRSRRSRRRSACGPPRRCAARRARGCASSFSRSRSEEMRAGAGTSST